MKRVLARREPLEIKAYCLYRKRVECLSGGKIEKALRVGLEGLAAAGDGTSSFRLKSRNAFVRLAAGMKKKVRRVQRIAVCADEVR